MSTRPRDAADDPRRAFRSLFLTYPAAWRARHEDVVLDTLLAVHADRGTSVPGLRERLRFAVDGMRVRLAGLRPARPVRRFATHEALAPMRPFDQTNGLVADGRPLDERDQVHANAAAGSNADEQRIAPLAWFRLDAAARPDRPARRRRR